MKSILLLLFLVVVVAGVLGTLAAKDPGYVLISYDGSTFQTGLWVFLGIIATGVFLFWLMAYTWRLIFGSAARIQAWRNDRRLSRSVEHSSRGLLYLQEGNTERAIKFLISGAKHQSHPAVNYLHLAEAFDANGDTQGREKYLRLALESDANSKAAVAMLQAELAFKRGEYDESLALLDDAPKTNRSVLLKKQLLVALKKWNQLQQFLPELKKLISIEELNTLEKTSVLMELSEVGLSNDRLLACYRNASEATKSDPDVLLKLCESVDAEKEIESIIRKAVKQAWQPELVEVYAELGKETLSKRLKTAQSWQKTHPLDASLSYCIGELFEALEDKAAAMTAYQAAVEHGNHRRASRQLANLYAFDGDHQKSNEYLNVAYRD